jgi:hypothetical protein
VSGNGAGVGFTFDVDVAFNITLNNHQATSFGINTNSLPRLTILSNGKVGIATTNPTSLFSVGATSQFQIDANGNIIKINNVTYSWPAAQGAATTFLQNDGLGNLSWSASAGTKKMALCFPENTSYLLSKNQTVYGGPSAIVNANPSFYLAAGEIYVLSPMPACTVTDMYVYVNPNTISANTTITLRKNQVNQALVINIPSNGVGWYSVNGGAVVFNAGDMISIQLAVPNSGTSIGINTFTIFYQP